jgi:hypothetical protein
MQDVQIKLTEFSDLITRYTADFVGREWLVEQMQALLDDPDCRFVVLTGGPGVGKTAFLAHLAATHPQWLRYFIRRDSKDLIRPGDANTFLLTVGGQLAMLYPHLFHPENLEIAVRQRIGEVESGGEATAVRIEELRASPFYRVALLVEQEIRRVAGKATAVEIGRLVSEPRLMQMQGLQYLGLLDPARLLAREDPSARIVVLVDALDELRYSPAEPDIVRALRELPEMPPNLRFVISSRPEVFLEQLLARDDAKELPLDMIGVDNLADLRAYAERVVGCDEWRPVLEQEDPRPEAFIDGLLNKAAGNFLYLKSALGGIQQALEDPAKQERLSYLLCVEELPNELGGLYGHFLASIVKWAKDGLGPEAWQESLRPFLGVLAVAQEPLTEGQIAAFTELEREDIRDLQRELHQFVEVIDGQRLAYRIYHTSFAEYLLDSEQNRNYWIDGQERHCRIADCYLNAWGGLEANLPGLQDPAKRDLDGGYGLRHLAAHLEEAGRIDDLHRLLRVEHTTTEQVTEHKTMLPNWLDHFLRRKRTRTVISTITHHYLTWYTAREQAGDTAGFLDDLARTWRLAEESGAVGLQCRYALIMVSLNSLATNIFPALLIALVEKKVWNTEQALAHVQGIPYPRQRVEALIGLASYLPEPLNGEVLERALIAARTIRQDIDRAEVLSSLVSHLPKSLQDDALCEALAAARAIQSAYERKDALMRLIPHLPEPLKGRAQQEAQEAEHKIESDTMRLKAPSYTPGRTRDDTKTEILEEEQAELKPLKGEVLQEALATAREIHDMPERAGVLAGLVPHLSQPLKEEVLREAIAAAQGLPVEDFFGVRNPRSEFLVGLAPHLSESLLHEALTAAREIKEEFWRSEALAGLAPYLPQELLREALMATLVIQDERQRSEALARLAPNLPESLPWKALAAVQEIEEEHWQSEALVGLAPRLAELGYPKEALAAVRKINNKDQRSEALTRLVPHLAELGYPKRALEVVREIGHEQRQVEALTRLAPCLAELGYPKEALAAARKIRHGPTRAQVLVRLAPHLPEPLLRKALLVVLKIGKEREHVEMMARLAQDLLPELLSRKAWVATLRIGNEWDRVEALVGLARYLPEPLLREALAAVLKIRDEDVQVWALAGLAPYLPETLRGQVVWEVLAAAREIGDELRRAEALAGLASYLPQELLREALTVALAIQDERRRSEALTGLAPNLPESLLWEALGAIRESESESWRSEALARLAPNLPESLLWKALEAAREIRSEYWSGALVGLATRLAELGYPNKALAVVCAINGKDQRAEALAGLVPHLPEPLKREALREALVATREIGGRDYVEYGEMTRAKRRHRNRKFTRILDERDIMGMGWHLGIWKGSLVFRAKALTKLAPRLNSLSRSTLAKLWLEDRGGTNLLHVLATRSRRDLLADIGALVTVIAKLGGEEAVFETFHAIQDVGRWWP